jgi:hypothetical protein
MGCWKVARTKIVEILTRSNGVGYSTIAADRVFDTPNPPASNGNSETIRPYIAIYEEAESIKQEDSSSQTREFGIAIELVCERLSDLDILREQVQHFLLQTQNLEDTVAYFRYKSGTPGYSEPNQSQIFAYTLRFSAEYDYEPVADSATLTAWKTANIKYGNYSASDNVTLPQ